MRNRFLRGLVPALALAALPAVSSAGLFVGVSVNIAPPPLPVYVQPPCPEPGYLWTPGYWAWDDGAYYWVPGTWIEPPEVGLLWTPGYWGWGDGLYIWHAGYWGPHVGFYGGVDYGYGYDGAGFEGGYWRGRDFFYNRAVVHVVGPRFGHNVYSRPVVFHSNYQHVSFNGGPGGVRARASHEQMAAEHEHHFGFTSPQQRQQRMAFADHSLRADYNHGRPPIAATTRPAMFHGSGAFAARAAGGPMHYSAAHNPAPMRSDRPAWASGQNHAAHTMMHGEPAHGAGQARPEQQRFEGRQQGHNFAPRPESHNFDARPQNHGFEAHGSRPMERPQPRPQPQFEQHSRPQPQPQFHQSPRPQPHFEQQSRPQPQFHESFRAPPHGPAERGPAPHPQQRGGGGGGERPHHPPQDRGHNR